MLNIHLKNYEEYNKKQSKQQLAMALYKLNTAETQEFFRVANDLKKKPTFSPRLQGMMKRWKAVQIIRESDPSIHMKTTNLSSRVTEIAKTL
jgi:hypothetical protein